MSKMAIDYPTGKHGFQVSSLSNGSWSMLKTGKKESECN
jgi:hypothetical protein